MLRAVFTAVAGRRGSLIFIAVIVVIGIALVLRDLRQSRDRLRPGIFAGMLGESILLASVFGIVVGVTTAKLLGSLHSLSLGPIDQTTWSTRLMLSLGAGLYEELFFRVLLVTGIAAE